MLLVVAASIGLATISYGRASALTISVPPHAAPDCYTEPVSPGGQVELTFVVSRADDGSALHRTIDAIAWETLWDDKAGNATLPPRRLEAWQAASQGSLRYAAPTNIVMGARFTACFHNEAATVGKRVEFVIRKGPFPAPLADEHASTNPSQTTSSSSSPSSSSLPPWYSPLEWHLHYYANTVGELRLEMLEMRHVEAHHRETVESTNAWLYWSSVADVVMLVVAVVFQLWWLRRFLSVRYGVVMGGST